MGDTTIGWTDKTWNPTRGCRRVSAGCENCYAERQAARFSGKGQPFHGLVKLGKSGPRWTGKGHFAVNKLAEPLSWRDPCRVFVDSMSDLFFDAFTNEEIAAVFGVMAACPWLTFQILTKRPERMREWFAWIEREASARPWAGAESEICVSHADEHDVFGNRLVSVTTSWPLPNLWIGVSVENQSAADDRIPDLIRTPAVVRFLSVEPMLGPVMLQGDEPYPAMHSRSYLRGVSGDARVHLVIVGCESGPKSRTCETAWIRSVRDQCEKSGTALFLKQARVDRSPGGYDSGCLGLAIDSGDRSTVSRGVIELPYLDGVQHAQFPKEQAHG